MDVPLRAVPGRRCKVLFSYQPANDDELELQVGDLIEILSEVEEGWWRGKLNGQVGVFPSNFVSEVVDDESGSKEASHRKTSRNSADSDTSKPSNASSTMNHDEPSSHLNAAGEVPQLPPKPMKELCRVLFPYEAVNDDELTLREGDVITIISRDGQDKGWWRGELNGKVGVFPDNFIQVITAEESKPARPPAKTNIVTTNRVKDSITRPSTTTPQATASRKSIELPPKPDEKTSPPGIGKKPQLPPPPLKKPQRSPSGASSTKTLATDTKTTATTPTKPPDSPTNSGINARIPLTPLTFSLKQASTSDGVDGGCLSSNSGSFTLATAEPDVDLDCVGRTAMLTHPTASRVRAPRRRPPSGIPVKESPETTDLVNGNAESHLNLVDDKASNKAPWVEELKMNQAKKNSAQGRTRVMISGTVEPPSSVSPEPPKVSPVTLRGQTVGQAGARPQSMFGSRSFSLSPSPSPSSPDTVNVSNKQWSELNEKVQRLESKLEAQQEAFVKAIKELSAKLAEESDKRATMQAEIEKLTNFITQV